MTALVIVAGGLGSRLAPLTDNIPKFLVNIGKNTGYVEMIRYWEKQLDLSTQDDLTVIVHSTYAPIVKAYHELYFPKIPLTIKTVDVANGSAHAILSTCDHVVGDDVLFAWCDIIPADDLDLKSIKGSNVIFTNFNNSNRYALVPANGSVIYKKPVLVENERGGCFGLYYVGQFHADIEYRPGQDFIEVIEQYGDIHEVELSNIIDFGDMPKLRRVQAKADEAREFNSIEFIGDYVLKQAMNDQGRKILKKEVEWYQHLDSLVESWFRPAVPRTWIASDGSGFFMSKVQGVPIWKAWHQLSSVDRAHVLSQLIQQRQNLFRLEVQPVQLSTVLADVKQEAYAKLIDRYTEIKAVLDAFGQIRIVNRHQLSELDPIKTINRVHQALAQHYTRNSGALEYGFIHGDLQFSNSMVDLDTMKVTIIDPRGYFGKTSLSGLEDYDIGKLMYALSGYDSFNTSRDFFITREGGALAFGIPAPSHVGIEGIIAEHFKPVHRGWLAVCWIGLAQYVRNDPIKSIAAHYHGLVLAEKWLASLQ